MDSDRVNRLESIFFISKRKLARKRVNLANKANKLAKKNFDLGEMPL